MMSTIPTNTALGKADNVVYVFCDLSGKRNLLRNEKTSDEPAFLKFANAKNLPELMVALDELYEQWGHTDFISDLMGSYRPESISEDEAEQIAVMFEERPTRTTLEKTREALNTWRFDSIEPSEDAKLNIDISGRQLYLCTPLDAIIAAKEDLRRTSMLMAWLIGKTDFQSAHGMPAGDRKAKMRTIKAEEPAYLHEYYESLAKNTGNLFAGMNAHAAVEQIHLYRESDIESTVASYVKAAFTLLMSDERKVMDSSLFTYRLFHTILSGAWSFFADGLNREDGPGAIGVCKHCHKFFEQQRSTKQFCSDSCRVMHLRYHESAKEDEGAYVTNISKSRKQIKEWTSKG